MNDQNQTPDTPAVNPPAPLKGTTTTMAGVLSIIFGGLGLFSQFFSGYHGQAIDSNATVSSFGALTAGIGLLKAADAKQK